MPANIICTVAKSNLYVQETLLLRFRLLPAQNLENRNRVKRCNQPVKTLFPAPARQRTRLQQASQTERLNHSLMCFQELHICDSLLRRGDEAINSRLNKNARFHHFLCDGKQNSRLFAASSIWTLNSDGFLQKFVVSNLFQSTPLSDTLPCKIRPQGGAAAEVVEQSLRQSWSNVVRKDAAGKC